MRARWIWPLLVMLAGLVIAYQFEAVRQVRRETNLYRTKVDNAFRYTARHMDLTGLPDALEALAANPGAESLQRASLEAEAYSELLFQLNDLRQSGPPLPRGGLETGTYAYHPATGAQADMQMQLLRARLRPSLGEVGDRLKGANWQLLSEDRQFLLDAADLVRQLNTRLAEVRSTMREEPYPAFREEAARQKIGQIGPDLDQLALRIAAHRAALVQ